MGKTDRGGTWVLFCWAGPCSVCGSAGKESVCNVGDLGLIPGLGRSPGEGNSYSLQYSCLENSMDRRSLVGYSPWDGNVKYD